MIPDLALIITAYVLYRLVETTMSAIQRNKAAGIFLGVLAVLCGLVVCGLAFDIVNNAAHSSGPPIP
jgi:hypothetical protein